MHMNKLVPNIMVENVKETLAFYQEVLGFTIAATSPKGEGPYDWASIKNEGVELMFQSRASLGAELPALQDKPIGGSLTFYIDVEDVQALHERVQRRAEVVQDMQTTFYGAREFGILDNNGFILVFGEKA